MNILLDTHALIWWFDDFTKLSKNAISLIKNSSTILVSAASTWEIAIKVNQGKLNTIQFVMNLEKEIEREGFIEQPITMEQSIRAGLLPLHHRDPFDRLLVAQAQSLNLPILSSDTLFDRYDIQRIW